MDRAGTQKEIETWNTLCWLVGVGRGGPGADGILPPRSAPHPGDSRKLLARGCWFDGDCRNSRTAAPLRVDQTPRGGAILRVVPHLRKILTILMEPKDAWVKTSPGKKVCSRIWHPCDFYGYYLDCIGSDSVGISFPGAGGKESNQLVTSPDPSGKLEFKGWIKGMKWMKRCPKGGKRPGLVHGG